MVKDSDETPKKQKPVPPKPPAPKPHEKFLTDSARSGPGKHGGPHGKPRIIRHQGR